MNICSGHSGHSHMFRSLKDSSWDRVRETFVLMLVLKVKTVQTPGTALETALLHYSGCSSRHRHRAGFCKCRYCIAWRHSAMECQKPGRTGKKQGPRKGLNKLQIRSQSQVQINAVITVESRMQQLTNSQFIPHIVSFYMFELSLRART